MPTMAAMIRTPLRSWDGLCSSAGMSPDLGISRVEVVRSDALRGFFQWSSKYAIRPNAMKFSMIVEMTSLTPRVTFRNPATPAQAAPTAMPTSRMTVMWMGGGRCRSGPTAAAMNTANRYWPSTPMLNRFILKPMATARAEMYSGIAVLTMAIIEFVWTPYDTIWWNAVKGFLWINSRAMEETRSEKTRAPTGATRASTSRRHLMRAVRAGTLTQ